MYMKKSVKLGKLLVIPYESYSNYVNLPSSTLERISKLKHFEQQYFFELKTSYESVFYVGVKEFTDNLGCIEVPMWLSENINEDYIHVSLLRNVPKGDYVKIEPQSKEFFKIQDNDKILEKELVQYCLLSIDQIIPIKIFDQIYTFKIIEIKSIDQVNCDVVDIININLNVDFENKFMKELEEEEKEAKRIEELIKLEELRELAEKIKLEEKNKLEEHEKLESESHIDLQKLRELRLKYYDKK